MTLGDLACAAAAVDQASELELMEARFAGAIDELRFRITLLEAEGALEAAGGQGGDCAGIRGQLSAAQGHLDDALAAGLEERIAAVDRRRLEDLRGEVEERCAAAER